MSRLIDADKITFFNCLAKTGNAVCCHAEGIVSKSAIEMQPTIEAIPIDWLRMWFTKEASLIGIVLMGEIESAWEKENEM